jgi:membrane-associated PAP2 superfamily phosphatase
VGETESALRFHALHAGVPLLLAALVLAVFEGSALDLRLQDVFYDAANRTFPLEDDWFLETVIHDAGKLPVILVGVVLFAAFALSFHRAALVPWRRRLFAGALCMALCPLTVAGLKASSAIQCPERLVMYGGRQPYVRLFDPVPAGASRGHCWPGGHASGGFALMGLYFVFRGRKPRLAGVCLAAGIACGFVLGLGRVVQGAHFSSHVFWAGLVCWAVALALDALIVRRQAARERSKTR